MRHPLIRSALAASTAGLIVALAGCATPPELMPEPELPEPVLEMDVGVNYLQPSSDIVIMDPSYQHVVLPDGARVAYRPGWEDEAMDLAASTMDAVGTGQRGLDEERSLVGTKPFGPTSKDVTEDQIPPIALSDLPRAEDSRDPVYRAWKKLCEMRQGDMTDEEMQIVLNKKMPEALEGLCNEGLNWLAELK